MSKTQSQHFEDRVADLRAFRKAEREAVQNMERTVDDPIAFAEATRTHEAILGAVRSTAAELAVVYYE
jgi:hypothetical protein